MDLELASSPKVWTFSHFSSPVKKCRVGKGKKGSSGETGTAPAPSAQRLRHTPQPVCCGQIRSSSLLDH